MKGAQGSVKAVSSGLACNEEMGLLKGLVDASGGGEIVYRSLRAPDEIPLPGYPILVRRKDLAPNVNGAELFGFRRVGDDEGKGGLEEAAAHSGVLLVVGDNLDDLGEDFGSQAELFVYLGTHTSPATANAHIVLPITTFAEQEGSFTNVQGRVQRFWPGIRAPGSARPGWLVLGALLAELTGGETPRRADEAFEQLEKIAPEFGGITYRDLGTRGAPVNEPATVAGD
jgi:hypothetical protein